MANPGSYIQHGDYTKIAAKIGSISATTNNATTYTCNVPLIVRYYSTSGSYTLTANKVGYTATATGSKSYGEDWGPETNQTTSTTAKEYTLKTWSISYNKTHAAQTITVNLKLRPAGQTTTTTASTTFTVPVKTSYLVTYNGNNKTNGTVPSTQTKWYGESLTLSTNNLTRTGYTRNGWNTKADGSGTHYNNGASYTANAALTLYAQWTKNNYTLTANANGGTIPSTTGWSGTGGSATKSVAYQATYGTLPTPTRTGYTFAGWYSAATGGTSVTSSTTMGAANATIYARWTEDTYTISYNNNGGSGTISSTSKNYTSTCVLSNGSGFTRSGYNLIAWNTANDNSGTRYSLGQTLNASTISSNLTLYAVWEQIYIQPQLNSLNCYRTQSSSISDTTEVDDGTYIYITFNWVNSTIGTDNTNHALKYDVIIDSYESPNNEATTNSSGSSGTVSYKFTTQSFSKDTTHNVTVKLYDDSHINQAIIQEFTISTAIYPIDLYGQGTNVYMGVMHKYETGQILTVPDIYIDGDVVLIVDDNASGEGHTTDGSLNTIISSLGWTNDINFGSSS